MKVVLDTNIIIYAVRGRIDLKEAIGKLKIPKPQIIIPTVVMEELENLRDAAMHGSDRTSADLAVQIIKHQKLAVKDLGEGHADMVISSWSQKNKAAVVTNDSQLALKLKELKVPVYGLRQRRYIRKR